ncbi:MAG: MFS transporter [Nitrososphaerota archaeon]|jgi:MFS family permease|nr:MFS transporter [Nitrososphaerota archaeon]MDG6928203.1 MFS transporter [Nitrososphaerota archaeon]MDG6930965.1 MFS transporter [Nitrososphaerota archaeon]MDG6932021.1 MFS transporter [Nitrososphaerota archaeon]MDG6936309.1 MFS transporter [Nitrososphaerota archaeon]
MFTENREAIDRSFNFLLTSRALRSVSLILVNLSLSLYLKALGYGLIFIGIVYFLIIAFNVIITLLFGVIGDRIGYAKTMIVAEALPLAAMLGLALSVNMYVIIISAMVGGITGSPGGMRGAFSPGMTSYIASNWPEERERVGKLSRIYVIASVSSIAGSVLLVTHGSLSIYYGAVNSFRLLFGVSAGLTLLSLVSLFFLKERRRPKKTTHVMKRESFSYMLRIIVPNIVNGAGIGIAFPLLPLWFELMYKISASYVGVIFTIAYAFTAAGSYISGKYLNRSKISAIAVSSWARILQGVMLIAIAFMPFLALTVIIYSARSLIAGVGSPMRSAISVRGISGEDFGTASGIQGVFTRSSQLTSGISGYLMEEYYPLPLLTGGIMQVAGALVFYRLIRSWEISHNFK